jgi:cellulose biosynthesis protein BcsQ
MKSICFFNNKGGVGKTTLIANVASYLATERALRVLVVDADPQCNATQLILADMLTEKIFAPRMRPNKKSLARKSHTATLYEVLRPIALGESEFSVPDNYVKGSANEFGVDLLPGDPRVSLLEDKLSQAWLELAGGDIGGARQTNWNRQLCNHFEDSYDILFFDVGPSLGALNRSVLVGVDFFVVPMGCDVFSLFGVSNIAEWLRTWFARYQRSIEACEAAGFAAELDDFNVRQDITDAAQFIGYTVQQYITKAREGVRRPTASYERIRNRIPSTVQTNLGEFMARHVEPTLLQLPDVPHMYSLVPQAQHNHCPIHRLTGLTGGQPKQREAYSEFIASLADAILVNSGIEETA